MKPLEKLFQRTAPLPPSQSQSWILPIWQPFRKVPIWKRSNDNPQIQIFTQNCKGGRGISSVHQARHLTVFCQEQTKHGGKSTMENSMFTLTKPWLDPTMYALQQLGLITTDHNHSHFQSHITRPQEGKVETS